MGYTHPLGQLRGMGCNIQLTVWELQKDFMSIVAIAWPWHAAIVLNDIKPTTSVWHPCVLFNFAWLCYLYIVYKPVVVKQSSHKNSFSDIHTLQGKWVERQSPYNLLTIAREKYPSKLKGKEGQYRLQFRFLPILIIYMVHLNSSSPFLQSDAWWWKISIIHCLFYVLLLHYCREVFLIIAGVPNQTYDISLGFWDREAQNGCEWGIMLYYRNRLISAYNKVSFIYDTISVT